MSQHDLNLANQSGLLFRQDLNNALQALATKSSGTTDPASAIGTTYAYQWWIDTSGVNPILKIRNAANNAWITVGRVDLESLGIGPTVVASTAPSSPLAGQFWADTSGANPILKIRSVDNSSWITLGRIDVANFALMPLAGGVFSGPITFSNTDSMSVPVGTTAQRPGSPTTGMIRFNSDLTAFEGYSGSVWASIGGGGYVVTSVQTITSAGTIASSTTDNRQLRHVQGNGGAITTSTTPFGTGGGWKDGAEILLVGNDDTNTVSIPFNDAAKGCVGEFETIILTKYKTAMFVYSSSLDRFILRGGL